MNTYRTSEVAEKIGIHPNTVRLYEELGLIPRPQRQGNGYRVFTDLHVEQFRLARLAFQIEVMQNGLREKIIHMVKVSAAGDYDTALELTREYIDQVKTEIANAEEAIESVKQILHGESCGNTCFLKRKEVSEQLNISMDTLRNWEMNGPPDCKTKKKRVPDLYGGGYQTAENHPLLKMCDYSLEAILSMLSQLAEDPDLDIRKALDTPRPDAEIIAVCDKLITSLTSAEENARRMLCMLQNMKRRFGKPSS